VEPPAIPKVAVPIDSFLTQIASRTRFVDVSLAESEPLLQEVERAVQEGTPLIEYTGDSILRGAVGATDGPAQGGGGAQEDGG
jgi:hypothetical protein